MDALTILGLILSVLFGLLGIISWISTTKTMTKINTNIDENKKLISSTTDLLEVSSKIGISAAHVNREIALQKFDFIHDKTLIVVGSSLKGLKMFVPNLEPILKARSELGLENRFLLTHPCRSKYREHQETRPNGEIKSEIDETVDFLLKLGINKDNIRFYLGTPTNFLLITSKSMLINPYPYQIEAYRCFCLEVERKPILNIKELIAEKRHIKMQAYEIEYSKYKDIMTEERFKEFCLELKEKPDYDYAFDIAEDIYGQFYWHHYYLPWYSRFSITYDEYNKTCIDEKCNILIQQERCKIIEHNNA